MAGAVKSPLHGVPLHQAALQEQALMRLLKGLQPVRPARCKMGCFELTRTRCFTLSPGQNARPCQSHAGGHTGVLCKQRRRFYIFQDLAVR